MPDPIPVGDILRSLKLPGWLRSILNLIKGQKVRVGGTDILLGQKPGGATTPHSGLDQPHKIEPPKFGGPRR